MRIVTIATIACALGAVSLSACAPKVEKQGDKMVVTGAGGIKSTVSTGADAQAAAAALPAYAPVYPGATVINSSQSAVGGTIASAVGLTTPDAPEKVTAFYKEKLGGAGLGQVSEINLGLGRMVVAEDGATGKGVQVMAMKSGDLTRIQITQSTTKPKS